MNRADKISKLCHAVKDWRGVIDSKSGKWIKPPKIRAGNRVIKWLMELGLNAEQERTRISQFTKYADFYAWVRSLDELNPAFRGRATLWTVPCKALLELRIERAKHERTHRFLRPNPHRGG